MLGDCRGITACKPCSVSHHLAGKFMRAGVCLPSHVARWAGSRPPTGECALWCLLAKVRLRVLGRSGGGVKGGFGA